MNELEKKSILEMSMGAILERVDYEMGRVIDNILDPNTKPNGKRKITVGLELTPSADRRTITVQTTAKSTLVPTDPITTSLYSRLLAFGSRRERRFGFHTQKRGVTPICVMQMPICGLRMTHRIG